VLCVETIGKIRRWHRIEKLSISQIARRLGASRNTVKKYLKSNVTEPKYRSRPKRFLGDLIKPVLAAGFLFLG
jgi:transposase